MSIDKTFQTVNVLQKHVRKQIPQQREAYQAYADAERVLGLDSPESVPPMKGYEHIRWGRKAGTFVDAGGSVRTIPLLTPVKEVPFAKFIPSGITSLDADEAALAESVDEDSEIESEEELIDAETDIAVDADSAPKVGTDECE